MTTNLLEEERYSATFAAPIRVFTSEDTDVIDIWPSVNSVPAEVDVSVKQTD